MARCDLFLASLNCVTFFCSGDEEESFWRVIKSKILDENVELIEMVLRDSKNTQKPILCRACQRQLDWFYQVHDDEIDFDVVEYRCICVMAEPIFCMKISESSERLLTLLDEKRIDPQFLAVSLNLVLIALYNMANPAPPLQPENPILRMAQILEEKSYMLRLGGKGSVIFAELYDDEIIVEGSKLIKNFPILYLADTMTIPTRFFLYPLRFKMNAVEGDYQNNLIEEMIVIANDVIKSGSNLILGSRLKAIITPDCYKNRKHNFATIVDIDSLSIAPRGDGDSSTTTNEESAPRPDHIWDEIMKPIITLCSGINVLVANLERVRTAEQHFEDLRQYLNAAIWLKAFNNSPFETFLYAILTRDLDKATAAVVATEEAAVGGV